MNIGFTGTHIGMTELQYNKVSELIQQLDTTQFHHGDCIGADAQAYEIVLSQAKATIINHPPENPTRRAYCEVAAIVKEPKPYLVRNKEIVDETELLIAAPHGFREVVRSGTWTTVRYARRNKRKIIIVWKDGTIKVENW